MKWILTVASIAQLVLSIALAAGTRWNDNGAFRVGMALAAIAILNLIMAWSRKEDSLLGLWLHARKLEQQKKIEELEGRVKPARSRE